MAVYIGRDQKRRLRIGSTFMRIPNNTLYEDVILKSFDNYILKDSNGLYLTAKEGK